jgi:DNA-binding response OmpR family regulator
MPPKTRSHVLCVDDDADAREMLKVLMDAGGIDVSCATSATEAWSLIERSHFDLYLLDGWLPGLDGFEFCRQLREARPDTPILFYSGAAYETDKRKGMAAGATAYVVKPDIEGLIRTVVQIIGNNTWAQRRVGSDRSRVSASKAFGAFSLETASD